MHFQKVSKQHPKAHKRTQPHPQPHFRSKSGSKPMLFKTLNYTFPGKPAKSIKKGTHSRLNQALSVQIVIIAIVKFLKCWKFIKEGAKEVDKGFDRCNEAG